ncbi:hypothetical protein FRC03_010671 [Tulasnella sp. 419]|nr:hypothetical protein FRC03_010671 [Tulasnella sp. 419]
MDVGFHPAARSSAMAPPNVHFDSANDIEKGNGPVDSYARRDFAYPSPSTPFPSNDPLSPNFGATAHNNISALNLNTPIPPLSLDSTKETPAPEPLPTPDSASSEDVKEKKVDEAQAVVLATLANEEIKKATAEVKHVEVKQPTATPQSGPQATKWVKFLLFFNTYRKLFTLVVILNGVGLLMAALDKFPYARKNNGAFILGNLLMAVMMRNELFLRGVFWVVNKALAKWPPLIIRLGATSVLQHLGGVHSGCAVSGLAWLIYRVVTLCMHAAINHKAVIATGIVTNVAIIISVISAFPWIRNTHHNIFERHHRFIGWLGLLATWVFVLLGNAYDIERRVWDWSGHELIQLQDFYFVLGMTIFIILPWTFTRKVKVDVEIPSNKVAVLRFERGMQQGLLGRISRTSIMEYHAFGIISEGKDAKYHYMVCGVQGDFTRGLVENPPTHLWTRELKFAGVSNTSTLYKRGIRIATGTGIGAALSTCLQNKNWFLIWIGSDNEKTFGKTIANMIENGIEPERRILWDTKKLKRPDTMKLLKDTYDMWGAEVVFITSNLQGNTQMMEGCKMLGIPAFGTLWDF